MNYYREIGSLFSRSIRVSYYVLRTRGNSFAHDTLRLLSAMHSGYALRTRHPCFFQTKSPICRRAVQLTFLLQLRKVSTNSSGMNLNIHRMALAILAQGEIHGRIL